MVEVRARHDLSPAEVGALEDHLHAFNIEATGCRDGRDLGFVVEAEGHLLAGLAGYTWGGICEIRQLWVHEDHRRQGLGAALLETAVAEAAARGCAQVLVATYDFQAPAFYERHGFERVAEIPDKPLGHVEFVMRRRLASAG